MEHIEPAKNHSPEDSEPIFQPPPIEDNGTKNGSQETTCKWVGCSWPLQPSQPALVSHIAERHLRSYSMEETKSIACHWAGCGDYGVPKFTKPGLTNHLRIHTGEKRYFCPIPECAKFFGKQDVSARHIKAAHELHATKEGLVLNRDRVKRLKVDHKEEGEDDDITPIELDDELRTPWWYSLLFVDTLRDKEKPVHWNDLLDSPINEKKYRAAVERYRHQVGPDPTTEESDFTSNIEQLQKSHEVLERRLNVATKVSTILGRELDHYKKEKRKLWIANQILIDANVKLGLSPPVKPDSTDEFILESKLS